MVFILFGKALRLAKGGGENSCIELSPHTLRLSHHLWKEAMPVLIHGGIVSLHHYRKKNAKARTNKKRCF